MIFMFILIQESAVRLLTEATELYLEMFCGRLRQERDREAGLQDTGCGWPDILEKVSGHHLFCCRPDYELGRRCAAYVKGFTLISEAYDTENVIFFLNF
jgi:hypothetical protein